MMPRILVISFLSLGTALFSTSALATQLHSSRFLAMQSGSLQGSSQASNRVFHADNQVLLGSLAILMLGAPALGMLVYKQHVAYRHALRLNTIENLERIWKIDSHIQ